MGDDSYLGLRNAIFENFYTSEFSLEEITDFHGESDQNHLHLTDLVNEGYLDYDGENETYSVNPNFAGIVYC